MARLRYYGNINQPVRHATSRLCRGKTGLDLLEKGLSLLVSDPIEKVTLPRRLEHRLHVCHD
jgi:hypothetical protein